MRQHVFSRKIRVLGRRIVSLLIAAVLTVTSFGLGAEKASAAPADGEPDGISITLKRNDGTGVIDNLLLSDIGDEILVKDGDRLSIRLDFSSDWDAGDSYTLRLPKIFSGLTQSAIESQNADALSDGELAFDLVRNGDDSSDFTINFVKRSYGAAVMFTAVLNIDNAGSGDEWEVDFSNEVTLVIKPDENPGDSGGGGTEPGRIIASPPPPVPREEKMYKHMDGSENANIGMNFFDEDEGGQDSRVMHYNFTLNDQQNTTFPSGTLVDELPLGMRLFVPNAPGYAENNGFDTDDYSQAYRSFGFRTISSGAGDGVKEINGEWYFPMQLSKTATSHTLPTPPSLANLASHINQHEIRGGRQDPNYDQNNFDTAYVDEEKNILYVKPTGNLLDPKYINDDGKPVYNTLEGLTVGYKIYQKDGKDWIQMCLYDDTGNTGEKAYEESLQRSEPWDYSLDDLEDAKCVPLRVQAYESNSKILTLRTDQIHHIQEETEDTLFAGWVREDKDVVDGFYTWEYEYNGKLEFTLRVATEETEPGIVQDVFQVEIAPLEPGMFLYGKAFEITSFIYFDQSVMDLPSEAAVIKFRNTATYGNVTSGQSTSVRYTPHSASAKLSNMSKAVDKSEAAPGETLKYSLSFGKKGNLPIRYGMFWADDVLDSNLKFVDDSIRIYLGNDLVSDPVSATEARTSGDGDDELNLSVEYIGEDSKIFLRNFGDISVASNATVRVEFEAEVKAEAAGKTVTNTFGNTVTTEINQDLSVQKVWIDDDDAAGDRPDFIEVQLLKDGVPEGLPVTLNGSNGWRHLWDDLPDGPVYTVEEIEVPGYDVAYDVFGTSSITITNTYTPDTPDTVSRSVKKVWDDEGNADRPDSIQVQLRADGDGSGYPVVTLNGSNNWEHTWTGLPEGKSYTIEEINVPDGYASAVATNTDIGWTVTNTYTHAPQPGTVSRSVEKVWDDEGNADRPDSVEVQLLADGDGSGYSVVTLNDSNNWEHTWTGLPEGKSYTIEEINVPDGYTSVTSYAGTNIIVTNTYTTKGPEPGKLILQKLVSGNGASTSKEFRFTVDFSQPVTYKGDRAAAHRVTLRHGETAEFTGIPLATDTDLEENATPTDLPVTYTITEDDYSGDGYTSDHTGGQSSGSVGPGGEVITFVNSYDPPDNDDPPDDDDDDDDPPDDDPPPRQPPPDDDDPNDDDDYTPIGDDPVPLTELSNLTNIFDDNVSLAQLPKSGGVSFAKSGAFGLAIIGLGALLLKKEKY